MIITWVNLYTLLTGSPFEYVLKHVRLRVSHHDPDTYSWTLRDGSSDG